MSLSLPLTIFGVQAAILHQGGGAESFEADGGNGKSTIVYLCAWADRLTLRQFLLGDAFVDESGHMVYIAAAIHPDYPGLVAQRCQIEAMGKPTGAQSWMYARLVTEFCARDLQLKEEEILLSGEVATTDSKDWLVEGGDHDGEAIPDTHAVNKPVSFKNYTVTLYRQAKYPDSTVDALFGQINAAEWNGYAAHTVYYSGYVATRTTSTSGTALWTVKHHTVIGPRDMRKEFVFGQWNLVKTTAGEYKFESGDFTALGF